MERKKSGVRNLGLPKFEYVTESPRKVSQKTNLVNYYKDTLVTTPGQLCEPPLKYLQVPSPSLQEQALQTFLEINAFYFFMVLSPTYTALGPIVQQLSFVLCFFFKLDMPSWETEILTARFWIYGLCPILDPMLLDWDYSEVSGYQKIKDKDDETT